MRIAMIGQKGIPCTGGGVERHVEELSRHLITAGYDVVVYTRPYYTSPRKTTFHGVSLVSLPSIRTKHLDAISHALIATMHAMLNNYDVIHYHGVGPVLCAWLPRLFTPHIRIIGTYHSEDWKQEKWGLAAKIMLRFGAWMIARVPHHALAVSREIYESLHACGSRVSYIPTGVTPHTRKPSRTLLAPFKLGRLPYILLASRFVRHKSVHDAIGAFKLLKSFSDRRLRKVKLVLAGGSSFTNDYFEELKKRAQGRDDILFVGYQSGTVLEALFAHATLFLQPSSMEGRSIALLEALAWGTPVAAADTRESREVLTKNNAQLGSLFTLHNLEEIASLMRAATLTPVPFKQMAAAARQSVIAEYDWEKIIPLVDDLYMRLAASPQQKNEIAVAAEY
ncbi:hypothetical protein A2753_00070 [Candidatus Uhrbacteria bacterium RIFCSPHIGHO2_01_FULL_47_11]|nr:MAG: hypothetical protein A2753_00070 [Candidatus Uhrbacteria bacterium RIFCSPHIGHO2_01_FULL_47_11]